MHERSICVPCIRVFTACKYMYNTYVMFIYLSHEMYTRKYSGNLSAVHVYEYIDSSDINNATCAATTHRMHKLRFSNCQKDYLVLLKEVF